MLRSAAEIKKKKKRIWKKMTKKETNAFTKLEPMTLQSLSIVISVGPQRHIPHDLAVTKQSGNHWTTEAHAP